MRIDDYDSGAMSSKSAAGKMTKNLLLYLLEYARSGRPLTPAHKKLRYARRMNYVESAKNHHTLTEKGRKKLNEERIWNLSIPQPSQWDSKWRLVMFDIPLHKRRRRDSFRRRLQELGLKLYQNSVWIYPYPLEDVVYSITDFYNLSAHVSCITAESITDEYHVMQKFDLL